jgi:hypothetical protein
MKWLAARGYLEMQPMDMTNLMISLVAGMIGMGMVMFAKSTSRLIPGLAGLGLMIIPYFIANAIIMTIVCVGLTAIPFIYRDE